MDNLLNNMGENQNPMLVEMFQKIHDHEIGRSALSSSADMFLKIGSGVDLESLYTGFVSFCQDGMAYFQQKKLEKRKEEEQKQKDTFIEKAAAEKPVLKQVQAVELSSITKPTLIKYGKSGYFTKFQNGSIDTKSFLIWLENNDKTKYQFLKSNWK
jgi:esterase/lipase